MPLILDLQVMIPLGLDLREVAFHIFEVSQTVSLGIIWHNEGLINIYSLLLD